MAHKLLVSGIKYPLAKACGVFYKDLQIINLVSFTTLDFLIKLHISMEVQHPFKPPHIGRASELKGRDRVLYRFLEMLPGTLAWGTILGAIILSYFTPTLMAFFIIAFCSYLTAPLGVKLTHLLPIKVTKRIFACLLIILSFKMLSSFI